MKISSEQIRKSIELARTQQHEDPSAAKRARNIVLVSPDIHDVIRRARIRLLKSPDEENEEVEELHDLVENDTYEVPSTDIAEKIIGRVISDQIR